LLSRIGFFQQIKNLHVPELRIAAVGLGFDIGPPHMLLPLAERPGGLAGHGATLAGDTAVDVEDEGELTARESRLIGVGHFAAELPVMNVGHG
jgi:hypothetical protein